MRPTRREFLKSSFAASLASGAVVAAAALPLVVAGGAARTGSAFAWPSRATLGLGMLCFLAMMSEGAVIDWAALNLRQTLGVRPSVAALGFAAFAASMATGRLLGDALRARFGARRLTVVGFDGYQSATMSSRERRMQDELIAFFDLLARAYPDATVVSMTPTSFPILQRSIYGALALHEVGG